MCGMRLVQDGGDGERATALRIVPCVAAAHVEPAAVAYRDGGQVVLKLVTREPLRGGGVMDRNLLWITLAVILVYLLALAMA